MNDDLAQLRQEHKEYQSDLDFNRRASRAEGLTETMMANLISEKIQIMRMLENLDNRIQQLLAAHAVPAPATVQLSAAVALTSRQDAAPVGVQNNVQRSNAVVHDSASSNSMDIVAPESSSSTHIAVNVAVPVAVNVAVPVASAAEGSAPASIGAVGVNTEMPQPSTAAIPNANAATDVGNEEAVYTSSSPQFGSWNVTMVEACKEGLIAGLSIDGKFAICGVCSFNTTTFPPNSKKGVSVSSPLRIKSNSTGPYCITKWNEHLKSKGHQKNVVDSNTKKRNSSMFNAFRLEGPTDVGPPSKLLKNNGANSIAVRKCMGFASDIPESFVHLYVRYCRTSTVNDAFIFRVEFRGGIPATVVCSKGCTQICGDHKTKKLWAKQLCDGCFTVVNSACSTIDSLRQRIRVMNNKDAALKVMLLEEIRPEHVTSLQRQMCAKKPAEDPPALSEYFTRIQVFLDLYRWRQQNASVLTSLGLGLPPLVAGEAIGRATSATSFIARLAEALQGRHGEELNESVPMAMVRALLAKFSGHRNPKVEPKLLAFADLIHGFSPVAYRVLRANTAGPSERHLKRLNATDNKKENFVYSLKVEDVMFRLNSFIQARKQKYHKVSLAFDGTILAPGTDIVYTTNQRFKVGAAFPDHLEPVVAGSPSSHAPTLAREVKCCLLTTHSGEIGQSSTTVLAARPSKTGEACVDFAESVMQVLKSHERVILLSVGYDGAKSDAFHVVEVMMKYFQGNHNTVSVVDPNHNAKNLRSALVLGTRVFKIGSHFVDKGLFALTNIPQPLWNVSDYTSDALVLKLASGDSLKELNALQERGEDASAIVLYLFFLRLYLMGVNGDNIPRQDRVLYLWSSLLFITSVEGVADVTKMNLVKSVMGLIFLSYTDGVNCLRLATTEGLEHKFGEARQRNREFSAAWFLSFVLKLARRMQAIATYHFKSTHSGKGYGATAQGFEDAARIAASGNNFLHDGTAVESVMDFTKPLVDQIAPLLLPFLNKITPTIKNLLTLYGVKKWNPLFDACNSTGDLQKMYYSFCDSISRRKLDAMGLGPKKEVQESKMEEFAWDHEEDVFDGLLGSYEDGDPELCSSDDLEAELEAEALQCLNEIQLQQAKANATKMLLSLNNMEVFPRSEDLDMMDIREEPMPIDNDGAADTVADTVDLPLDFSAAFDKTSEVETIDGAADDGYVEEIQDVKIQSFFRCLADNAFTLRSLVKTCVDILPPSKGYGSISSDSKCKSRMGRFSDANAASKNDADDCDEETTEGEAAVAESTTEQQQKKIYRGVILIIKGKLFKVLACFEKGYNKWRLVKETAGGSSVLLHVVAGKFGGYLQRDYRDVENPIPTILRGANVFDLYDAEQYAVAEETRRQAATALRANNMITPDVIYKRGDRVLGKYELSRNYFRGTVQTRNGTGTYHILFDHGCNKGANPQANPRHVDYAVHPKHLKPLQQSEFKVCDNVVAIWNGTWNWQSKSGRYRCTFSRRGRT